MKQSFIHGIDFGPVWAMSGLLNFYGQGWPYHTLLHAIGVTFEGVTLVSKTTTLHERPGNMPLKRNLMPKELFPESIYINWRHRCALNAVSLSGPGASVVVSSSKLHQKTKPLQLSFMSVAGAVQERLDEFDGFRSVVLREQHRYHSPLGIQINLSCPNTEHQKAGLSEIMTLLDMCDLLTERGVAIIPKVSIEMSTVLLLAMGTHRNCHGFCTSNTVPFGKLPQGISWENLFPNGSPLLKRRFNQEKIGRGEEPMLGGLSGAPIFPLVLTQVKELRKSGFTKHINAGGGILSPKDAVALLDAGADSISIGSVAFLAPLRVNKIIEDAHRY